MRNPASHARAALNLILIQPAAFPVRLVTSPVVVVFANLVHLEQCLLTEVLASVTNAAPAWKLMINDCNVFSVHRVDILLEMGNARIVLWDQSLHLRVLPNVFNVRADTNPMRTIPNVLLVGKENSPC